MTSPAARAKTYRAPKYPGLIPAYNGVVKPIRQLKQEDALASADRFWAKVDRRGPDECWPWLSPLMPSGYGQFGFRPSVFGKPMPKRSQSFPIGAHRVAYTLTKGTVPLGKLVLHNCDNRGCMNPDHLYAGTEKDNVQDMFVRGRDNHVRGEKHRFAKLTGAQVAEIRARYVPSQVTLAQLAEEYGVSRSAIFAIVSGRSWPDHTRYKGSVC